MPTLIDKERLIRRLKTEYANINPTDSKALTVLHRAITLVDIAPTVDTESLLRMIPRVFCNACGDSVLADGYEYCPHCGAKMSADGVKDNEC